MIINVLSLFLLGFLVNGSTYACESKGPNVLLFTMDGVREQEFFKGTASDLKSQLRRRERGEIFRTFWNRHSLKGVIFGKNDRYRVASTVAVSLPSYQALMTGHATDCKDNHCGTVKEETVLESVSKSLKLDPKDVAVFASWEGLKDATAKEGSTLTRAIYPDSASFPNDSFLNDLQAKAMTDLPPWKESRKDEYTFEMGIHYLKNYCPRVLYISLVDSDEYGHLGDYPGYVRSLRTYDEYIDRIIKTLDQLGEYGKNTTLFVTTDHSRGSGANWKNHGTDDPVEKNIFLFVKSPNLKIRGASSESATHANIRPTIEKILGVPVTGSPLPNF